MLTSVGCRCRKGGPQAVSQLSYPKEKEAWQGSPQNEDHLPLPDRALRQNHLGDHTESEEQLP